MLHVLLSNNPEADATGALPVTLHTAVRFRGGHGGSLMPREGKNWLWRHREIQLHKAENLASSGGRTVV